MEKIESVLTIKEIAEILRCSKTHVANLLSGRVSGAIPLMHLNIGRRKVVRRVCFDRWLGSSEVSPQTRAAESEEYRSGLGADNRVDA